VDIFTHNSSLNCSNLSFLLGSLFKLWGNYMHLVWPCYPEYTLFFREFHNTSVKMVLNVWHGYWVSYRTGNKVNYRPRIFGWSCIQRESSRLYSKKGLKWVSVPLIHPVWAFCLELMDPELFSAIS
jgi:hypothetical protein